MTGAFLAKHAIYYVFKLSVILKLNYSMSSKQLLHGDNLKRVVGELTVRPTNPGRRAATVSKQEALQMQRNCAMQPKYKILHLKGLQ